MTHLLKLEGADLFIETDTTCEPDIDRNSQKPVELVGRSLSGDNTPIALEKITDSLRYMCESLTDIIDQIPPDKRPNCFSATFGIKISGEGNIYIVKTSGEASLSFTAEWKRNES